MNYRSLFRHSHYLRLFYAVFLMAGFLLSPCYAAVNTGSSQLLVNVGGSLIRIYLYHPSCADPSILMVFHGLNRKAKKARDNARTIAEDACLVVFAPLFDKDSFPNWRYHRAGIVRHKKVQPPSQWTAPALRALLDFSRKHIANPNAKIYLFGHSAGGQFLSRTFAYTAFPDVERVVIANPSVYVEPTLDVDAPYGFAGVFDMDHARKRLRSYLSSRITIYIGTNDIGDKYLVKNNMANRQGRNRYERGRHIYFKAMSEAARQNTPFLWKLTEACGIGHSSAGMIKASEVRHALGLTEDTSYQQHLCSSDVPLNDSKPVINGSQTSPP